jgi:hypothetical protein
MIPPMLHTYFHLLAAFTGRILETSKKINALPDIWSTGNKSNFAFLKFCFHGLT